MSSTIIPVSSSAVTSYTTSPTPPCSAFGSYGVRPDDVEGAYCFYNSKVIIPNLSSCCKDGAEVRAYNDCVRYCEVTEKEAEGWRDCVIDVFPEADQAGHVFPCVDALESASPTEDAAEQSDTAGTEDGEGTASVNRPSLTVAGWVVAFLAVGAGFMA